MDIKAAALVGGLLAAATLSVQQVTLAPVDQGLDDASFFAFRAELLDAAVRRDVNVIRDALAPGVMSNFWGGDGGPEEFFEYHEVNDPESLFWPALVKVLANGGAFIDDDSELFQAPYWAALWPDELDPYDHALVRGVDIPGFDVDSPGTDPVTRFSYEIVRNVGMGPDLSWTRVVGATGDEVIVASNRLESFVGFRALFRKQDGRWLITVFVAGD